MLDLTNKSDKWEFGKRIKDARKKCGLSQEKLMNKLNMTDRSTISSWETGTHPPEINKIPKICAALNIDTGYLFGDYDSSTFTTQNITEATGLTEKAINKLHSFTVPPLDYEQIETDLRDGGVSRAQTKKIIADTRKAHEPFIINEYPNTVSLLLEHKNAAKLIGLITMRIKETSSQSKTKITTMCGHFFEEDEIDRLDFAIQTELNSIIRDISATYRGNNAE